MKISDPLGKVYTHTMFKKKSYNIPKGGEEEYLERARTQSEEEEDAASDISEASDDSLSTKSSRWENSSRDSSQRYTELTPLLQGDPQPRTEPQPQQTAEVFWRERGGGEEPVSANLASVTGGAGPRGRDIIRFQGQGGQD